MADSKLQIRDTLSGLAGAIALTAAGTPFDVVKIRLQLQQTPQSPYTILRGILASEGVFSLWRGALAGLSSALVENAVVFTANKSITRWVAGDRSSSDLSFAQHAFIGGISGCFSATAICPAEVIKCRLQAARAGSPGSAPASARSIVISLFKHEGPTALFSGLTPLLMRDVPFNTLFFGSYRVFCALWDWSSARWSMQQGPGGEAESGESGSPGQVQAFMCGGFAGMAAWSVIFPFDTIKSRMQTAGPEGSAVSTVSVARQVWREGGARALYRGYSAAVSRAFPANAALFWGVETADRLLRQAGV